MKALAIYFAFILAFSFVSPELQAQQAMNKKQGLDMKEQSIVGISALAAVGDWSELPNALNDGLDAGLAINQIKEVLVHLYAYIGFPRSLQGINLFMALLEERKAKGIRDILGKEATAEINNPRNYAYGKKVLETLTGQPEKEPKTGYAAFAPVIDTFLKEHLFADIFGRDILTYTERELATMSALASMGGVEPMLGSHMKIALHLGISEFKLSQLLSLIESKTGKDKADAGRRVLNQISGSAATHKTVDTLINRKDLFAIGAKAPVQNFTGTVWVNMLMQPGNGMNISIGSVRFEPGARSNWHQHPGGQVLLVTGGKGYYQESGKSIRIMQKGDVVQCLPGIEHWHGASPESGVSHIAIVLNSEKGNTIWLRNVTDEEYKRYK
jgi:4-carboxymuconolactone decarboxylase